MAVKTRNFNPRTDTRLRCTCGHPCCDQRSIDQDSLDKVQLVREDYGAPMVITSGGRCPNHPDELKRSKPGDHQKCTTVDVRYKTVLQRNKLMVLAGRHGATRVAFGRGFVHMSWSPTADKSVPTWKY
jgi:hypothetical protein